MRHLPCKTTIVAQKIDYGPKSPGDSHELPETLPEPREFLPETSGESLLQRHQKEGF